MVDGIGGLGPAAAGAPQSDNAARIIPKELNAPKRKADLLELGKGEKPSNGQAQGIVLERAYERLRQLVGDARAELGIPEGAVLDTSPEATANRIADFALGFFGKYAENNGLADDEAGRKQFVDFIGKAVAQGIDEARGILGALNALNPEISGNIDKTAEIIQQRFEDFISGNGA
ncbi:MAG: hypothetical protein RLZZ303_1417 [Candidatus Hydrogenedentota bacterium]|jgi:hypothetical protein